jgi:CheY-like chemotaxis protein
VSSHSCCKGRVATKHRSGSAREAWSEETMKTFLVIEDSSVIRKVARRILDGLEFEIAEAENGEEAVEACRKRMPEGILLDWNMPKWTATISCARCVGFQGATGRRS